MNTVSDLIHVVTTDATALINAIHQQVFRAGYPQHICITAADAAIQLRAALKQLDALRAQLSNEATHE